MTDPSDQHIEKLRTLDNELWQRIEAAQADGLSEPSLARMLLNLSMHIAMKGEIQEFFDHILWVRAEGDTFLKDFETRLGDKIDIKALCRGETVYKH